MATAIQLKRLHNLIWVLVYGGLLTAVLGLVLLQGGADPDGVLAIAGGVVAAIGFLLIVLRSRLKETP